jgi:hypothetical protein
MSNKTVLLDRAADKLHNDYMEGPSDDIDMFKENTDKTIHEITACIGELYRENERLRSTINNIARDNRLEE